MPKIYTSDIAVLFQLLVNKNIDIVIYDIDNQVVEDSNHDYKIVNSVQNLDENANLILLSKLEKIDFLFKNCIDFAKNDFQNIQFLTINILIIRTQQCVGFIQNP